MKCAGEMLREFRESKGVTQTFLAKRVGTPSRRISAMETGELPVRVDEFIAICMGGFEVTPTEFFNRFYPIDTGGK